MSRTVPKSDSWSRLNALEKRLAALERTNQLDNASIHNGSLAVLDASGNPRVKLGLLDSGDYGLAFYDASGSGAYAELFPPKFAYQPATIVSTSTSYTAGTGTPSVTATLGHSGDAIIIISGNLGIGSVNDTAFVGLSIDGGAPIQTIWASDSASLIATSSALVLPLSQLAGGALTPGSHTFTLQQRGSTAGHTFNFTKQALVVWPT